MEVWKVIINYPMYSVSNRGNIKRNSTGKILSPGPSKAGYLSVVLYETGGKKETKKTQRVNRLVAQAFLPNPDILPMVDHKDRNPSNNEVGNLRWVSAQGNSFNKRAECNSSSKYVGVSWFKRDSTWRATIGVNRKQTHLGYFKTEEEAYTAYLNAKEKLHIINDQS